MSVPRLDETRSFVRALARRAGTRVVLYVPAEEPARTVWISDPPDTPVELARLEDSGRRFMARLDADDSADGGGEPGVAIAALRSANSEILGAIVAAKDTADSWSEPERAIVRFAVDFYGPALDRRAASPGGSEWLRVGPDIDTDIRDALDRDELALVYQPEIDLQTREVIGLEALLRWQHPTRGELSPDAFIEQAERSGLIRLIGAWVIDTATRALAEWRAELPGLDVMLRVNISPVQIRGAELVDLFRAALETHGVPGRLVAVELTENAPLHDASEVADTLRRLKELGITSAIDDLATGYSTLSQLRALPVDTIKLDRSLISGLDRDPRAHAIVTALIGLALNFGLQVVAEGVESEAEAEVLLELGCTRAQGHHLAKPVAADAVLEMLRERGFRAVQNG